MASPKSRPSRRPTAGRPASGRPTAEIPLATPTTPVKPAQAKEPEAANPEEITPEPAAATAGSGVRPPRWLQYLTFALALVGLALSAYETWAHFNGSHLAGCPSSAHATFDCTAVITSSQSMVFGVIPVAILGLLFYVFAVAIFSPWAWRLRRPEVGWLRLGSMIVGMGFVVYLIYAEVYQIKEICEYCTGVHIITFLLFCITVFTAALWGLTPADESDS
ncbi:MAG TPA: vitamin K epoxide reductase family protein [Trebonia sp.]